MVDSVIKKDGAKFPFDSKKIESAIAAAASEAGIPEEDALITAKKVLDLVVTALGDKKEVASADIKKMVLSELDVIEPDIATSWRKYDDSMSK